MKPIRRREFLEFTALGAAVGQSANAGVVKEVFLVSDPSDPAASAGPVQWAIKRLDAALAAKGIPVRRAGSLMETGTTGTAIAVAGVASSLGRDAAKAAGISVPDAPEAPAVMLARRERSRLA